MLTEVLSKNHVNTEVPASSIVGPAKNRVKYSVNRTNRGFMLTEVLRTILNNKPLNQVNQSKPTKWPKSIIRQ